MTHKNLVLGAGIALSLAVAPSFAADEGLDRAAQGAVDTVTSPGQIVEGISEDTANHGVVGVVTGSVKGGVKAAGQAVTGAAKVGVGVVEAVTDPLVN